ncbi:MAG: hypothetical protein R3E52_12840 [Burkholderiaceae bacterium]
MGAFWDGYRSWYRMMACSGTPMFRPWWKGARGAVVQFITPGRAKGRR